jgi:hypothetical protein
MSVDIVVTRHKESLKWLEPYANRAGWRVFCYLSRAFTVADLPLCGRSGVTCTTVHALETYSQKLIYRTTLLIGLT